MLVDSQSARRSHLPLSATTQARPTRCKSRTYHGRAIPTTESPSNESATAKSSGSTRPPMEGATPLVCCCPSQEYLIIRADHTNQISPTHSQRMLRILSRSSPANSLKCTGSGGKEAALCTWSAFDRVSLYINLCGPLMPTVSIRTT